MLSTIRSRALWQLSRRAQTSVIRSYSSEQPIAKNSATSNETAPLVETAADAENSGSVVAQAPNRTSVWSRNQKPRAKALSGPRFEQTILEVQPTPHAAIELIHQQPVRWIHERTVACDGGGGPLGHPRIYINLDKPQICPCEYCGLPYANEHHRAHLESLPATSYPLGPSGHIAEANDSGHR